MNIVWCKYCNYGIFEALVLTLKPFSSLGSLLALKYAEGGLQFSWHHSTSRSTRPQCAHSEASGGGNSPFFWCEQSPLLSQ